MPRPRRHGGFTLLETLIALAILSMVLLVGAALLLAEPRVVRRIDVDRQALRAVESTLEALRAGALPLQSERLDGFATAAGAPAPAGLTLQLDVTPEGLPGLYRAALLARFPVAGRIVERRVETLVWRPGGAP
jgi:prepilin-type N-terminal cleavage/methylation domain-containing protein